MLGQGKTTERVRLGRVGVGVGLEAFGAVAFSGAGNSRRIGIS